VIFRSNLRCPDLTRSFPHLDMRVMPHSHGHSVPSDWADKSQDDPVFGLYKNCGLLTHDEVAILWNIARELPGWWLDIGSHTGWTTAHIANATGRAVMGIDPMYGVEEFLKRAESNVSDFPVCLYNFTSREFFASRGSGDDSTTTPGHSFSGAVEFSGVMVDGDHTAGEPLFDARSALEHLAKDGVIVFHDFIGKPVRDAVSYLIDQGLSYRVYWTPHVMACCWRGKFTPPEHYGDPRLFDLELRMTDFSFLGQGVCA